MCCVPQTEVREKSRLHLVEDYFICMRLWQATAPPGGKDAVFLVLLERTCATHHVLFFLDISPF